MTQVYPTAVSRSVANPTQHPLPVALQLIDAIDRFFVAGQQDAAIAQLKHAIAIYDIERDETEEPLWH
jgi:hypothetical protein